MQKKVERRKGKARKSKSSPSQTTPTESETSEGTISTTSPHFRIVSYRNGIIDPSHSMPPECLQDWVQLLSKRRESPEPSESEYQSFARKSQNAPNEMTMLMVTSGLLKPDDSIEYSRVYSQQFNNFPKDIGFNDGLAPPKPDMIEGLNLSEFYPFLVSELLSAAVPTLERNPPTLAHIAGEWKGPGNDMIQAQSQVAYYGSCLVYARKEALSYLGKPDPSNHAAIGTFTVDGASINIFAHFSSDDQTKYHQCRVGGGVLIDSFESYKKLRAQVRNLQDGAKRASEKLRDDLNQKWLSDQGD